LFSLVKINYLSLIRYGVLQLAMTHSITKGVYVVNIL
jgi:hypothetical protein